MFGSNNTENKYNNKPDGSKSNVIELSTGDFTDNRVTHKVVKKNYGILKAYAPWCGYCNEMVQDYNNMADALKSEGISVFALNYENDRELVKSLGVKGFPSMFMVGDNGVLENVDDMMKDRSIESMLDVICKSTTKYSKQGKCCKKVGNKIVC